MSNKTKNKAGTGEARPFEALVILPEKVTNIRLRKWEQQENYINGTEQKMMWLCELADTCVLEGDWDMRVTGYGESQKEAFDDAIKKWNKNQNTVENTVADFGFDPNKYTNEKPIEDYQPGDEVIVFDLSNYSVGRELPFKAKITAVHKSTVWVMIGDEKYEIYEYQFGEAV